MKTAIVKADTLELNPETGKWDKARTVVHLVEEQVKMSFAPGPAALAFVIERGYSRQFESLTSEGRLYLFVKHGP